MGGVISQPGCHPETHSTRTNLPDDSGICRRDGIPEFPGQNLPKYTNSATGYCVRYVIRTVIHPGSGVALRENRQFFPPHRRDDVVLESSKARYPSEPRATVGKPLPGAVLSHT